MSDKNGFSEKINTKINTKTCSIEPEFVIAKLSAELAIKMHFDADDLNIVTSAPVQIGEIMEICVRSAKTLGRSRSVAVKLINQIPEKTILSGEPLRGLHPTKNNALQIAVIDKKTRLPSLLRSNLKTACRKVDNIQYSEISRPTLTGRRRITFPFRLR